MIRDNESCHKVFWASPLKGDFVIEGHLPRASARRIPTLVVLVADDSSETGWWNDEGGEAGESAKAGRWWGVGGHVQNSSMNDLNAGDDHIWKDEAVRLANSERCVALLLDRCARLMWAAEISWRRQKMTGSYERAWVRGASERTAIMNKAWGRVVFLSELLREPHKVSFHRCYMCVWISVSTGTTWTWKKKPNPEAGWSIASQFWLVLNNIFPCTPPFSPPSRIFWSPFQQHN